MKIGRNSPQSTFFFDHKPIANSNLVKDLGVFINSDLNFSHHIHDFVTHAKQPVTDPGFAGGGDD